MMIPTHVQYSVSWLRLESHFFVDISHAQMMNLMQCLVLSRNERYNDSTFHAHTKHHDFREAELEHSNPELALRLVDAVVVAVEM